jgi:hypothetical protein
MEAGTAALVGTEHKEEVQRIFEPTNDLVDMDVQPGWH